MSLLPGSVPLIALPENEILVFNFSGIGDIPLSRRALHGMLTSLKILLKSWIGLGLPLCLWHPAESRCRLRGLDKLEKRPLNCTREQVKDLRESVRAL